MNILRFLPLTVALAALSACGPMPSLPSLTNLPKLFSSGTAPKPSQVADAAKACAALAGHSALSNVRITEATLIAPGTQRAREPGSNREVGEPLPEHCLVRGRIDERTGADTKPYYTGFELRLPSAFSGRLVYQGGGGNDGVLNNAVGRNTGALGWADHGLARGYAAVSTDAGHQSPGPEFGLDPQARIEHAYRAHGRTAATAKSLLASYYGRPADRSYFVGCAGGGRQGMMFTQRFPDMFDGVVAVAPAMRVSEGATMAAAWTVQRFMEVAPKGSDGKPVLAQALSDTQLKRVAQEIVDRCDAKDGLEDGLVNDTTCSINVHALQCPSSTEGCLSEAQAKALDAVMAGPRNSRGALYFGWPWDPGIADAGWRAWTLGTATQGAPNARHVTLMAGALGYEFVTPPDSTLSTLNFNFERDPQRMQAFHRVYDTADDVKLEGFAKRGGKLLFFHGAADPIFSAFETMDYQRRLNAEHGAAKAAALARSFIIPGMTHCSGGPATDVFDGLAAITRWVEEGVAPQQVLARGSTARPGLERPLCPYPLTTQYAGGDSKLASSFACR